MPRTKEQFEEIRKESRQKILDAALEVFARHGYHNATISMIAKTAGVSQGLLYNYFKSKEEVLHHLMVGMMEDIIKEFMPFRPDEKISRKHMIKMINTSVDMVLEKPNYWKMYFGVFVQPDVMPIVMDRVMRLAEPYMKSLFNYFKEKKVKDPLVMMRYFSAVMDGIQLHCMIDPKTFPSQQVKKLLIKQFA